MPIRQTQPYLQAVIRVSAGVWVCVCAQITILPLNDFKQIQIAIQYIEMGRSLP